MLQNKQAKIQQQHLVDLQIKILKKGITRQMLMEQLQMSSQHISQAIKGKRYAAFIRVLNFVNQFKPNQAA